MPTAQRNKAEAIRSPTFRRCSPAIKPLQMGTIAGARCAHVGGKAGMLTPGKEADIVILEARKAINTVGFFNIPGAVPS